jgi:hypothetical protein
LKTLNNFLKIRISTIEASSTIITALLGRSIGGESSIDFLIPKNFNVPS